MNQSEVEKLKHDISAAGNTGKNIGIFVDYDNIYYGLRDYAINAIDDDYNIFILLWDIYGKDKVRTMRAYADFDQINVQMRTLQQKRVQVKQVYGNGLGEKHRKNASDIELSIDAMETFYKDPSIDTYVFVTADSDMIPIMSRMTFKGKKVHLFYISTNTSQYQDITDYAYIKSDLIEILAIDINRATPSYWVDPVKNHITAWYGKSENTNKMYGGKWLNEALQTEFFMSPQLASSVIEHLENNSIITKTVKSIGGRNLEGYVIV